MSKPRDLNELRDQLLDTFDQVRNDPRRVVQAKEVANVAGKVIATLKLQLEYAALQLEYDKQKKEQPTIPFIIQKRI
jgi:hypothetical protein